MFNNNNNNSERLATTTTLAADFLHCSLKLGFVRDLSAEYLLESALLAAPKPLERET